MSGCRAKSCFDGTPSNQKLPTRTHFEQLSERFRVDKPAVSFFDFAPRIRELILLEILTYKPKKIYEAKKTAN